MWTGFGGPVSGVPTLAPPPAPPGPQPAGPAAPAGYTRRHPKDGYWNPAPALTGRMTVDDCAKKCTELKPAGFPGVKCVAFEVYVDSPPAFGNCYLFTSMKGTFTVLGPSRTYIRKDTADDSSDNSTTGIEDAGVMAVSSVRERAAAANLVSEYSDCDADAEAGAADPIQQAWTLLLAASDTLAKVRRNKASAVLSCSNTSSGPA